MQSARRMGRPRLRILSDAMVLHCADSIDISWCSHFYARVAGLSASSAGFPELRLRKRIRLEQPGFRDIHLNWAELQFRMLK